MSCLPNQPDIGKIGGFIKELRMGRGMTQRELGESLGVTDKAVSKWERGLSFPDVTLLPGLAQIFSVSIDELMEGARIKPESIGSEHIQKVVRKTMAYSKMSYNCKTKRYIFMVMGITVLLISIICFAVNYFTNQTVYWAPYVMGALLLITLPAIPILICKNHIFDWCSLTAALCLSGYLTLIHWLTGSGGWLTPLALPIAIVVCASAYGIGKAFIHFRDNKFYAWAITMLAFAAGPLLGVDGIVYLNRIERTNDISKIIAPPVLVVLAAALYLIGRFITNNERKQKIDNYSE